MRALAAVFDDFDRQSRPPDRGIHIDAAGLHRRPGFFGVHTAACFQCTCFAKAEQSISCKKVLIDPPAEYTAGLWQKSTEFVAVLSFFVFFIDFHCMDGRGGFMVWGFFEIVVVYFYPVNVLQGMR